MRGKPLRRADVAGRRQFLSLGAVALAPTPPGGCSARLVSWPGYGVHSGASRARTSAARSPGTTSHDLVGRRQAARARPDEWRLEVAGLVERPLELTLDELGAGDELVATLDCTGGFYSRQRWRGIALERLLSQARPLRSATHLRVISHTGYRWGFELRELEDLLLATHVGGEPLSHGHGAPLRLVARDRRGFQWVKWVVRIELHDGPIGARRRPRSGAASPRRAGGRLRSSSLAGGVSTTGDTCALGTPAMRSPMRALPTRQAPGGAEARAGPLQAAPASSAAAPTATSDSPTAPPRSAPRPERTRPTTPSSTRPLTKQTTARAEDQRDGHRRTGDRRRIVEPERLGPDAPRARRTRRRRPPRRTTTGPPGVQ